MSVTTSVAMANVSRLVVAILVYLGEFWALDSLVVVGAKRGTLAVWWITS